ncbi:hypothetical protein CKA32_002276 [Geitlerinema sp. FC II]|nr:hypothetical protein [Baaleninema simplex]MDC0835436.1 hypothetical protein [Geitlerinema sp. CS-897]PPT05630.1 hypothetical protein CKA32_002276 [Geitlerinema sp. FC II]
MLSCALQAPNPTTHTLTGAIVLGSILAWDGKNHGSDRDRLPKWIKGL